MELLTFELSELQSHDFDLGLTGFSTDELAKLLTDANESLTDPDEVPEAPVVPICQPGDVWVLGNHRLICGDSTDALVVEKLLGAVKPWIDRVHDRRPRRGIVLDMDSSGSPTHGEQENRVWNGHYECTCHHPLFVFNQFGDLERCALRPGNVHSADGWKRYGQAVGTNFPFTITDMFV